MLNTLRTRSSNAIFNHVHSRQLVYNTCWEDPDIDRRALDLKQDDDLLMITSAGCNALDYALAGVRSVTAVDLNYRQNSLLELKLAGIRSLEFDDFFQIFGRGWHERIGTLYRDCLRRQLSDAASSFWDSRLNMFSRGKLRPSFYFRGASGAFAAIIRWYLNAYPSLRQDIDNLLCSDSLDDQREIYFSHVKPKLWGRMLRWFVGRDSTLALVGVPPAQRLQIERAYPGGIVKFVEDALDSVFGAIPLSSNYFWRVYLTGCYSADCCPRYLTDEGFHALKRGACDRIFTATTSITDYLRRSKHTFSCYVLLDHMDWLSLQPRQLQAEWQQIWDHARADTRAIWRSGGLSVEYLDPVEVRTRSGRALLGDLLIYHADRTGALHREDRVHTYGSFYLATGIGA